MNTYVVTGGMGFVGSHLVDRLSRNNKIIVIDIVDRGYFKNNPNVILITEDIRTIKSFQFKDFNIDYVFHMAAELGVANVATHPLKTLSVELDGTMNVLDCFSALGVKNFAFASSSSVYGSQEVCREDGYVYPAGIYGSCKLTNEYMFAAYNIEYKINSVLMRFFNVYGPRQRNIGFVVPSFIEKSLKNEDLIVHGDGTQVRCFCYIDDLIDMILTIHQLKGFNIFNLGNPSPIQIKSLAEKIIKLTGSKSKIQFKDYNLTKRRAKWEIYQRFPDISKYLALDNDIKFIDINTGLKKCIAKYGD